MLASPRGRGGARGGSLGNARGVWVGLGERRVGALEWGVRFTVQVASPSTYPPLMWQSPGPAVTVSLIPMCIGNGTSTLPAASLAKAASTESTASETVTFATIVW